MRKTFIVVRHEFFQVVRRKGFYLITLGLPFIAFMGLLINDVVKDMDGEPQAPEVQTIGYVDKAGMFRAYTEQSSVTFIAYSDDDTALQAVLSGEIEEYFIIYENYLEDGVVERYTTEKELEVPAQTWYRIRDFMLNNLLASEVDTQLLERAKHPLVMNSWYLDESGQVSEPPDELQVILLPYVFGLLFIMSIFMTSGYLMHSVTEEKENRIMEVLLSSVSVHQLLRGKILGLGAAGLIQIIIWLMTIMIFIRIGSVNISALEDIEFPARIVVFGIIYFILGYGLFSVIYSGLGAMSPNARESQQMVGIFVLPAVVPLMLLGVIGEHPEGVVAKALSFIPITAPTTVIMRLANISIPVWEIGLSIAILLGSIILGMWLVAKIFRAYLLMYGKRPSVMEVMRALRSN
jgi:ABC-2 type transport system permease protein